MHDGSTRYTTKSVRSPLSFFDEITQQTAAGRHSSHMKIQSEISSLGFYGCGNVQRREHSVLSWSGKLRMKVDIVL